MITDLHIPSSIKVQISADVLAAQAEAARERAARAETMFHEQAEKAGVASEWLCEEGDRIDILSEQARVCDVAVIGNRRSPPQGKVLRRSGSAGFSPEDTKA